MTLPEPRFPDYGDGGDEIGARRSRRAFRRSVAAVILLSAMLFVSENYLRYDQTERLFRLGVSFPVNEFPSARTVLRSAVKQDAELHGTPTAKYYEALAEREEEDRILPAYAKAYELDPNNTFLAIRYGCALAARGQAKPALDVFRKAAAHDPHNALPAYLEAAVTPESGKEKDKPEESLALVARTNTSGNRIVFPRPLWVSGFPTDGACYQDLRRHIVSECCEPLLAYAGRIVTLADTQIKKGQQQNWDTWLSTLQSMGHQLAIHSEPGSIQVSAGLRIEKQALAARERLHPTGSEPADASLGSVREQIDAALAVLTQFEGSRDETIQQDRFRFEYPKWLWIKTFALLFVVLALAILLARIMRPQAMHWTIPHRRGTWLIPATGCAAFVVLASVEPALGKLAPDKIEWIGAIWWSVALAILLYGMYYPRQIIVDAVTASSAYAGHSEYAALLKKAHASRRKAVAVLIRRYLGIVVGLALSSCSVWIILFRIVSGIYPHYVELLTTGLSGEELRVVSEALALLPTPTGQD